MKILIALFITLLPLVSLACPNCHEAVGTKNPQSTLIVVAIFIATTYVPLYIFLKAAKKYDPKNLDGHQ
jgi:EamA domain-containing membrane protein RarD